MAVVSALSPVSLSSYFDPNTGAVMAVDLYFYKAGTLDPLPVYADSGLSVLHTQPLPSTGYGRVPAVFIGELPDPGYRVRVFNQYSELVEDLDNLPGAVVPDGGGGGGGPVEPDDVHLLKTGDYVFATRNATPREGAVLANGLTIGSATSTATGRANDDAHDLFVLLWGADEYGLLPVLPSRGASAEGDWLANKVITLPDLQCMSLIGMDAMGVAATGRLAGVPMQSAPHQPARVFARGGTALHTLTGAQNGAHTHTGTAQSAGAHTHTGDADNGGAHTHSGSTNAAGTHNHGGSTSSVTGGLIYNNSVYGGYTLSQANPQVVLTITQGQTNTSIDHIHAISSDGSHSHTVTIPSSGAHGHTLTIASGGAHTHSVVVDSAGEGAAHNNTPLFVTAAVYLVL